MFFTDKQLKERIKQLEIEKNDLEIEIFRQSLNMKMFSTTACEQGAYASHEQAKNNLLLTKLEKLQTRILELEDQSVQLEHKTQLAQKLQAEYHLTMKNEDKIIKELQTAKELKEKFETENTILKSANKVLSEVNTKVQPIMDENIRLNSQLVNMAEITSIKDETIKDLKSQLVNSNEKITSLMQVITKFQTKDAQVVQAQVIQPSIIEPTILSSKK